MGNYSSKDDNHGGATQDSSIPSRSAKTQRISTEERTRQNDLLSPQNGLSMQSSQVSVETDQLATITDSNIDDFVPTVFKWEHGGRNVYITGTFNNWERQIPMHRSGNDFSYIHNIKKGKHAFKFIVDDEWRFSQEQPTVPDVDGQISNYIDVSDFTPYIGDDHFFEKSKECKIPDNEFGQVVPDLDEYTKEPPNLPPHLRHIILNKPSPSGDPLSLPVPQLVSLNHLYCTAIKDGLMVLGATQRYREKQFTVVFYSVMPSHVGTPFTN